MSTHERTDRRTHALIIYIREFTYTCTTLLCRNLCVYTNICMYTRTNTCMLLKSDNNSNSNNKSRVWQIVLLYAHNKYLGRIYIFFFIKQNVSLGCAERRSFRLCPPTPIPSSPITPVYSLASCCCCWCCCLLATATSAAASCSIHLLLRVARSSLSVSVSVSGSERRSFSEFQMKS